MEVKALRSFANYMKANMEDDISMSAKPQLHRVIQTSMGRGMILSRVCVAVDCISHVRVDIRLSVHGKHTHTPHPAHPWFGVGWEDVTVFLDAPRGRGVPQEGGRPRGGEPMEGGRGEVPSPLKFGRRKNILDARTLLTGGSADLVSFRGQVGIILG